MVTEPRSSCLDGYLMLPAWLLTYAFTAATTIPTMAMTATAQSTCSVVTEPRSSRRSSRDSSPIREREQRSDESFHRWVPSCCWVPSWQGQVLLNIRSSDGATSSAMKMTPSREPGMVMRSPTALASAISSLSIAVRIAAERARRVV